MMVGICVRIREQSMRSSRGKREREIVGGRGRLGEREGGRLEGEREGEREIEHTHLHCTNKIGIERASKRVWRAHIVRESER